MTIDETKAAQFAIRDQFRHTYNVVTIERRRVMRYGLHRKGCRHVTDRDHRTGEKRDAGSLMSQADMETVLATGLGVIRPYPRASIPDQYVWTGCKQCKSGELVAEIQAATR